MAIEDYEVDGVWRKSGKTYTDGYNKTYSAMKWHSMLSRCDPNTENLSYATYHNCTISENFKDFQFFTVWHRNQVGYNLSYQLDKDLLVPKNNLYSEDTCVLVPSELNYFIRGSVSRRGGTPQGVSYDKERGKYLASISEGNNARNLGRFDNPEEAHQAYCKAKDAQSRQWVERLQAGEFLVDARVLTALQEWDTEVRYA